MKFSKFGVQFNFTVSYHDKIMIIEYEMYELKEAIFILWIIHNEDKEIEIERKKILNADQLIIDFSNCTFIDGMEKELIELNNFYLKQKGKEIIFSGVHSKLDSLFQWLFEEDYPKFKKFKSKEEAINFYLENLKS